MFFVLAQTREGNKTYERNIRLGGYRHRKTAEAAALRDDRPCIVRDDARNTVMMTKEHQTVFTNA